MGTDDGYSHLKFVYHDANKVKGIILRILGAQQEVPQKMYLTESGNLQVSGTVTANTFSGALSGNATTATTATTATSAGVSDNVKIDSASNSGSQYYLVFADGSGSSIRLKVATNIRYTPSSDIITTSAESTEK